MYVIRFTPFADSQLKVLENDPGSARILKDVQKALAYMEKNLRHPSLNTHEFYGRKGPLGEKIFESYAQKSTSSAYRIFWHYGSGRHVIMVIAIIPHP